MALRFIEMEFSDTNRRQALRLLQPQSCPPYKTNRAVCRAEARIELAVKGRRPPNIDNQLVNPPEPLASSRSVTALNPVLEPLADNANQLSIAS